MALRLILALAAALVAGFVTEAAYSEMAGTEAPFALVFVVGVVAALGVELTLRMRSGV